jgi:hypothetical protein
VCPILEAGTVRQVGQNRAALDLEPRTIDRI